MKHHKLFFAVIITILLMSGLAVAQDTTLIVTKEGNVGIGTSTPSSQLEVVSTSTSTITATAHRSVAQFIGQTAGGSPSSPTAVMIGTEMAWFGARGYTGVGFSATRAAMIMNASENWSTSAHGAEIAFGTTANGTTSRAERMRITQNGNVGIGTQTPLSQLEVVGPSTTTITATAHSSVAQFIGQRADGSLSSPTAVTNRSELGWFGARGYTGTRFSATRAAMIMNASENWSNSANGAEIAFGTTANGTTSRAERMRITQNGNVGIGTQTPKNPLEMASGAHVTAGGVWTNASSRTLKDNISELNADEALSALAELNPVRYNYKSQPGEEYLGFIAEDVPGLVATNARKSLSPMDIVAVLTKVVQQQQKKITELESRLNATQ